MRVYRIEHESRGHGPYIIPCSIFCDDDCDGWDACSLCAAREFADTLCMAHSNKSHRPPKFIKSHQVCAMESREALLEWFDGFHQELFDLGYIVAEYMAREPVEEAGQILFDRERSIRLTSTPI